MPRKVETEQYPYDLSSLVGLAKILSNICWGYQQSVTAYALDTLVRGRRNQEFCLGTLLLIVCKDSIYGIRPEIHDAGGPQAAVHHDSTVSTHHRQRSRSIRTRPRSGLLCQSCELAKVEELDLLDVRRGLVDRRRFCRGRGLWGRSEILITGRVACGAGNTRTRLVLQQN